LTDRFIDIFDLTAFNLILRQQMSANVIIFIILFDIDIDIELWPKKCVSNWKAAFKNNPIAFD
jgi:hypothetical protein